MAENFDTDYDAIVHSKSIVEKCYENCYNANVHCVNFEMCRSCEKKDVR